MKRREALSTIFLITGGTIILPQVLLSGCDRGPYKYKLFNWGDTELLSEIAEIIIPATPDVPGAKAADVGDFIQLYVTDCYKEVDKKIFLEGFQLFKLKIKNQHHDDFISLSSEEKIKIINGLEVEASEFKQHGSSGDPGHFYTLLKNTILFGYFTSEVGATKALQYLPVPGYQKGEIAYNGEKSWAL